MPAPDHRMPNYAPHAHKEISDHLYGAAAIAEHRLVEEVAKLRSEIEALRAEIAPKFSTIISGLEAVREFQRLGGK
jgi:hypothetical protein